MTNDLKQLEKNISELLTESFKKYSDKTEAFWNKAENAESIAKEVSKEIKRINQKLNNVVIYSVFFFMVCLILVFMIVDF